MSSEFEKRHNTNFSLMTFILFSFFYFTSSFQKLLDLWRYSHSPNTQAATRITERIFYVYKPETKKCYAVYEGAPFSEVDCEEVKNHLINPPLKPEAEPPESPVNRVHF